MLRGLVAVALVGAAAAFPNGLPFCVLRPEVQTTWAEQVGTTQLSFNQSCYNPGDELIVSLDAVRGSDFHGFVIRSDAGHFVRRHGFGGYRWLGDESNPDQSCITHIYPGQQQQNGQFIKKGVKAKLVVPNAGRLTPIRIIVEATAIKSFDDDVWSREWQSGVYSITRATINICKSEPAALPAAASRPVPRVAALKRSNLNSGAKTISKQAKKAIKKAAKAAQKPRKSLKRSRKNRVKFAPHKRCLQKSDAGRCPGVRDPDWVQPFYYDQDAGICRKFFYAGCGGNNNRFGTLKECERWCTGGEEPCAKRNNDACPPGVRYNWTSAYYLNEDSQQCLHYWYRSCAENDQPQFSDEPDCRRQCLGEIPPPGPAEPAFGPNGRCFELFDKDTKMCPQWASKKVCSPYPEDHENHWAHFNCRLSCCKLHQL